MEKSVREDIHCVAERKRIEIIIVIIAIPAIVGVVIILYRAGWVVYRKKQYTCAFFPQKKGCYCFLYFFLS